jgi:flagellar hook-length control protein FliK
VAPAKAQAPVPVEKFAQEMTGFVVNKLDIVKLQGMSEAKITLTPEHLGQVDIRITLHNGQVVAQFVTEHAFAKDSLEQQMAQLRSSLQAQGLQVEKLEVTQNPSLSSHMYHEGKQSGSGSQQRQGGKRRQEENDEGLKTVDTIEDWNEWVREVQAKQESYGSSFVAKA